MAEIKVTCVLMLREFDIVDAYKELDTKRGRKGGADRLSVNGERAYQVSRGGGGHPSEYYPCRARCVAAAAADLAGEDQEES
jgi:hypothetical protein